MKVAARLNTPQLTVGTTFYSPEFVHVVAEFERLKSVLRRRVSDIISVFAECFMESNESE